MPPAPGDHATVALPDVLIATSGGASATCSPCDTVAMSCIDQVRAFRDGHEVLVAPVLDVDDDAASLGRAEGRAGSPASQPAVGRMRMHSRSGIQASYSARRTLIDWTPF